MDQAVIDFRHTAEHENHGRHGLQRRYSRGLRHQAIAYWQRRRSAGEGVRVVAAALGVAPWSLHRWIRSAQTRPRFREVKVIAPEPTRATSRIVLRMTADGAQVEGLDVETLAQLLMLVR